MEAGGGLVTDDLAAWLLACVAEDERVATDDGRVQSAEWTALSTGPESDWSAPWEVLRVGGVAFRAIDHEARHAANWDPKRVLAECDAKRRIIAACSAVLAVRDWEYDDAPSLAEETLKLLALPYAGRPGYRAEWKP